MWGCAYQILYHVNCSFAIDANPSTSNAISFMQNDGCIVRENGEYDDALKGRQKPKLNSRVYPSPVPTVFL